MVDRTISIVLLALSGAALYSAIQLAGGAGGLRGAALPLTLAVALGLLSLALLVTNLRPAAAQSGPRLPAPGGGQESAELRQRQKESLRFFGLILLYVAAMEPLGFLLASSLAGTLVLRITFKEPWWKSALFALALAALGWFLFRQVLSVPLPPGSWLKGVTG